VTKTIKEADAKARYLWIDYLRGINILATVVFHSFIAYSPYIQSIPLDLVPIPYIDKSSQIQMADLMVLLRPMFSMQLMFFISGLFAWRGLEKRGPSGYIGERFRRLILPLAAAAFVLMPITYLPGYVSGEYGGMFRVTLGHLWFLWALFLFDMAIAALYFAWKEPISVFLSNVTTSQLYTISGLGVVVTYVSFALYSSDTGWGSLFGTSLMLVPTAWMPLYLFYFLLGVCMGNKHLNGQVREACWLSPVPNGRGGLLCASLTSTTLLLLFLIVRIDFEPIAKTFTTMWASILIDAIYALGGLAIILWLILIFKKYLNTRSSLLDNLAVNSYAIYIVHYTVVVWWQYGISNFAGIGSFKPWIVSILSIVCCWVGCDLFRRNKFQQRVA